MTDVDVDGFASIEALFYTVFHPTEGTKVCHQVPLGSIVPPKNPVSSDAVDPLFDFDVVKNYIIPKAPLCDRLVTLKIDQYRLVGYPVSINAPYYARNSFSFNFCFVFKYDVDTVPYESSIKRLGKLFKNLEEQYQILSKKEQDKAYFKNDKDSNNQDSSLSSQAAADSSNGQSSTTKTSKASTYEKLLSELDSDSNPSTPIGISVKHNRALKLDSVEDLIQQIYQDLNNYSECLIPIDAGNSVDIKLLPLQAPPARINPEDVPISTVNLEKFIDVNWDPTMLKILPFIDGINSVKRISELVNADYHVTKICIQHLMYYKCIILTDIFQFSNIYAPTYDIDLFIKDNHMAAECQAYVITPSLFDSLPFDGTKRPTTNVTKSSDSVSRSANSHSAISLLGAGRQANRESVILPSKAKLFYLYRSLHQGQTVKQWYKEHFSDLKYIDVRKFLTFGVLRGLIYRVQSYPTIDSVFYQDENQLEDLLDHLSVNDSNNRLTATKSENPHFLKQRSSVSPQISEKNLYHGIVKHLKAVDTFDSICTDLELDRKRVDTLLRKIGHHNVINS